MYTIIIFVGTADEMYQYGFWLQDFENAGLGKVLTSTPSLKKEIAESVAQMAKGRRKWNLIITHPEQFPQMFNLFLNELKAVVHREKHSLIYMPERIWVILKKYQYQEKIIPNDNIKIANLPSACRIVEYVTDVEEGVGWAENMKLMCIIILLAVNRMPSENFIVYQRHLVDISVNLEDLWQYIQDYKKILEQGIAQARSTGIEIAKRIEGQDVDILRNLDRVAISQTEAWYPTGRGRTQRDRNQEYFCVISRLKREQQFIYHEIKRQEQQLQIKEIELSQEDYAEVWQEKQKEEIEIVNVLLEMQGKQQKLEQQREQADKREKSAIAMRWTLGQCIGMGTGGVVYTLLMCIITAVELRMVSKLNGKALLGIIILGSVFGVYILLVLLFHNFVLRCSRWRIVRQMPQWIRDFLICSRKELIDFAGLCCGIHKKQVILKGHEVATKQREEKQLKIKKHYYFCKERIKIIQEWEQFLGGKDIALLQKTNENITVRIDFTKDPEREMTYNLLNLFSKEIPVNGSEKMVCSPFPFVEGITIERIFSQ